LQLSKKTWPPYPHELLHEAIFPYHPRSLHMGRKQSASVTKLLQPVRKILKVLMNPVTNDVIFYQDSKMAKETLLLLRVIEG
jgi:hypothetical protein